MSDGLFSASDVYISETMWGILRGNISLVDLKSEDVPLPNNALYLFHGISGIV